MTQWLRFHLAEGKIGTKRLVSAANLRVTHTPQMVIPLEGEAAALHPDTNQMSYGMGWVIQDYRGRLLVSHAGVIDGFRVHITLLPRERLGFVILANLYRTRMNLAASCRLVDLLLGIRSRDWDGLMLRAVEKQEQAARDELNKRKEGQHYRTKPSLRLAEYVGSYEHPAYGKARVTLERGRLVVRWSSFTLPLEHFHYDTFAVRHDLLGHVLMTFELDVSGRPARLVARPPLKAAFERRPP